MMNNEKILIISLPGTNDSRGWAPLHESLGPVPGVEFDRNLNKSKDLDLEKSQRANVNMKMN
jgi:hypothetical protein